MHDDVILSNFNELITFVPPNHTDVHVHMLKYINRRGYISTNVVTYQPAWLYINQSGYISTEVAGPYQLQARELQFNISMPTQ